MTNIVEIEATEVRFFSQYDESAFFDWLKKISCVKKSEGRGSTLYILIDRMSVDEDALRELLALFHRYDIDMRQLVTFDCTEFSTWFHNKQAYWYKKVFS